MAYRSFTLEKLVYTFALQLGSKALFPHSTPIAMSQRYAPTLQKGLQIALPAGSEKVRNELLVMPILLELQDLNLDSLSIHSGVSLNAERKTGLVGECDFLLSLSPVQAFVETPVIALLEAKKQDMEAGLGQCAAQMLGASLINQQRGKSVKAVFGCVTTGDVWRFMQLQDKQLWLDTEDYFITPVNTLLGVFQSMIDFYKT